MYLVACHLFCACRRYITYTLAADRVYHFHKGDWKLFKSHVESTTQNIAKKKMRLDTFPDHAVNTIKEGRKKNIGRIVQKEQKVEKNGACSASREGAIF